MTMNLPDRVQALHDAAGRVPGRFSFGCDRGPLLQALILLTWETQVRITAAAHLPLADIRSRNLSPPPRAAVEAVATDRAVFAPLNRQTLKAWMFRLRRDVNAKGGAA